MWRQENVSDNAEDIRELGKGHETDFNLFYQALNGLLEQVTTLQKLVGDGAGADPELMGEIAELSEKVSSLDENLGNYLGNQGSNITTYEDWATAPRGFYTNGKTTNTTYNILQYCMIYKPSPTSFNGAFLVKYQGTEHGVYHFNNGTAKFEKLALNSDLVTYKDITVTTTAEGYASIADGSYNINTVISVQALTPRCVADLFVNVEGHSFYYAYVHTRGANSTAVTETSVTLRVWYKP